MKLKNKSNIAGRACIVLHFPLPPCPQVARKSDAQKVEPASAVLHLVEGFALVMLCNCRLCPRRLSVLILREVKTLLKCLGGPGVADGDQAVIDVIDR